MGRGVLGLQSSNLALRTSWLLRDGGRSPGLLLLHLEQRQHLLEVVCVHSIRVHQIIHHHLLDVLLLLLGRQIRHMQRIGHDACRFRGYVECLHLQRIVLRLSLLQSLLRLHIHRKQILPRLHRNPLHGIHGRIASYIWLRRISWEFVGRVSQILLGVIE